LFEDLIQTIAQVAVTLAGYSGVIFALGNRSGRKLSQREESGLMHMLLTSFGHPGVRMAKSEIDKCKICILTGNKIV